MEFITNLLSERNWLDVGVLCVIGVFFLIGLTSGFIFSVFRIVSMVIALLMSLAFYEKIAGLVYGTYAESVINGFIYDGFLSNPEISAAQRDLDIDRALSGIIDMLRLPDGVAGAIFSKPADIETLRRTDLFDGVDLIGYFSAQCTRAVIALLSIIAVYVVIRTLIAIAKIFLDELAALKVFRLFNFIGGPLLGLIDGIAAVYVALALLMVVNAVVQLDPVYEMIETSRFARGFYERNMFLDFVIKRVRLSA